MEVVVTTGAISRAKLQSYHHQQQTNTQLFTGRILFLLLNQQCESTTIIFCYCLAGIFFPSSLQIRLVPQQSPKKEPLGFLVQDF